MSSMWHRHRTAAVVVCSLAIGGPARGEVFVGFEPGDGWMTGFLCGNFSGGPCVDPGAEPGENCGPANPNLDTDWYMSGSALSCVEPHIATDNPRTGTQHLRFSADPAIGCQGFELECRLTAFSPTVDAEDLTPTTIEFSVSGPSSGSSSLKYWAIGAGRAASIHFDTTGLILVDDFGLGNGHLINTEHYWDPGVYRTVRIELNPCINRLEYYYNGALIYETVAVGHDPAVERAVFQTDNGTGDWDIDDYTVTRGPACAVTASCGDEVVDYPEVCDGTGSGVFECVSGACYPPGHANECTCVPIPPTASNTCEVSSDAISITGATFPVVFNTAGATTDGPAEILTELGPTPAYNDIWFRYRSPCDGTLEVSLCAPRWQFDSMITVYGDTCEGEHLDSDDESCNPFPLGGPGKATVFAEEDRLHIIRISSFLESETGTGLLELTNSCDFDGDGIATAVDTEPTLPSLEFDDGDTTGALVPSPDMEVTVSDSPLPARGVRARVSGTGFPVKFGFCGGPPRFKSPGGRYEITCGSVTVEVLEGSLEAEYEFDGVIDTIVITAGGTATFVDVPGGVEVTAAGDPGTVTINGAVLDPGEVVDTTTMPAIVGFNGSPLLVSVGQEVDFDVAYEDDKGDAHDAEISFGDDSPDHIVDAATSPIAQSHVYTAAGIYTVTATVTDRNGNEATAQLIVVVYDPAAGFTTGGGWFIPDSGSFIDGVTVTNTSAKANFGFVVKYQNGASQPSGNLEFRYKAGNIDLRSTDMDWLVITSNSKVRFKGLATINNQPTLYTFKVTAEDNGEPGSNDHFKIEIWLGADVDTEDGGPTPKHKAQGTLGGGNIQVHHN